MNQKEDLDVYQLTRPVPNLMKYYFLVSLLSNVAIFVTLPVLWFRYLTLKYHFDAEGVSVQCGILFRHETQLTYRRIQDIHLTRNIFQRWLGISTVSIQTAAASATPEIQIEGIVEAEKLRDFLYKQMRGAKGERESSVPSNANGQPDQDEATEHLKAIREHLAALAHRQGVKS